MLPRKILAAFVTTAIAATGLVATVGVPPASATPGLPPPVQVNTDAAGAPQPGISDFAVSGNGRYVTFNGNSDWLSPGCPAGTPGCGTRMYVKDLASGAVAPVSDGDHGQYPDSNSYAGAMDNTGRYVAFISNAHNLVPGDAGAPTWCQVYLRDRDVDGDGIFDEPGQTSLIMLSRQWTPTTGQGPAQPYGAEIYGLAMSADGRYVSYTTPGDTGADVHVIDVMSTTTGSSTSPTPPTTGSWPRRRGRCTSRSPT